MPFDIYICLFQMHLHASFLEKKSSSLQEQMHFTFPAAVTAICLEYNEDELSSNIHCGWMAKYKAVGKSKGINRKFKEMQTG